MRTVQEPDHQPNIPHSVEEGLLDMLAARAADQDIGEGAYDKRAR